MKWPRRSSSRCSSTGSGTSRCTNLTRPGPARSRSRYARRSAEHVTTVDSPASSRAVIQSRIAASHGARSASVSGRPAAIAATLAGGWKSSPSAIGRPSRAARGTATVDLPEPDTPITTRCSMPSIAARHGARGKRTTRSVDPWLGWRP